MEIPHDIAIIGGGIVGLAVAHRLTARFPALRIVLVEKEKELAAHQTGHNSGVVHSGLYYKPGSAKARLSVSGAARLRDFCLEHGLPFEACGKVVVAVTEDEIPGLEELHRRGSANGVPGIARIGPDRLREIEPHAAGIAAVHVPSAAIADYGRIAAKLADLVRQAGGTILLGSNVRSVREDRDGVRIDARPSVVPARFAIACAGLQSDRLARRSGARLAVRIVPFRGEYYRVVPEREHLVRGLVYPVPDPRFPFLGVHLTRLVGGGVEAGPNAVLAFHREGYRRTSFRASDALSTLAYPGFWRLARRHARSGLGEMARSFRKGLFVRAVRRLVPDIRGDDLVRAGAGIRAQALASTGDLVDDFALEIRSRVVHVLNAPSPAATAALAIGDEIVDRARDAFGLEERGGRESS
jgi:L-2-hydroxyglutarate oxidase LhgO